MDEPQAAPVAPPPQMLDRAQPCVKCAYNLQGLPLGGVCPECGTPVADSLKGFLLEYASPEYRRSLMRGLSLVLNGILAAVVLKVAGVVASTAMGLRGQEVQLIVGIVDLGISIVLIAGYWFFTEPDPGYTGLEKPKSARRVLRVAVVAHAVLLLGNLAVLFLQPAVAIGAANVGFTAGLIAVAAIALLVLAAWAVQFFSMMLYVRWIARRVPDAQIERQSKTYMWLLPVLATVGSIACGLGYLAALVLYWNLLDRMRKHLKAIEATGEPAQLPGRLSTL